jgi:hypothetical protein
MEMDTWTLRLVVSSERDQNRLGRRRQIPALALPANGNAFLLPTSVSCSSHYPSHLHPTSLSYPSSPVRIAAPTSGDAHPPRKTGPLCPIRAIQTRQDTTITQTRLPSSLHRTTLTLINRVNPTHIPLLLNTNFRPRRTHLRLRPRRTPTRPHTPSRRRSTSTRIRLITRNPADSILCRTTPTHLSQRIIHLRNPTSNLSTSIPASPKPKSFSRVRCGCSTLPHPPAATHRQPSSRRRSLSPLAASTCTGPLRPLRGLRPTTDFHSKTQSHFAYRPSDLFHPGVIRTHDASPSLLLPRRQDRGGQHLGPPRAIGAFAGAGAGPLVHGDGRARIRRGWRGRG